jgi:hypothetical protein
MSESDTPAPGLTQAQREAILDLLLFGMYADDVLKISEDERLVKAIGQIGWHSVETPHEYMQLAIARVRAAHESHVGTEPFLQDVTVRLGDVTTRQRALDLLENLFESDGMIVDSERALHERVREFFGL